MKSYYFDTNIYIYYFEDVFPFADRIEKIFFELENAEIQVFGSSLLLTELLPKPLTQQNKKLLYMYQNLSHHVLNFHFIDINQTIAFEAANLRAQYGMETPDAIHIATAKMYQAKFFTLDERVKDIKGVDIVHL